MLSKMTIHMYAFFSHGLKSIMPKNSHSTTYTYRMVIHAVTHRMGSLHDSVCVRGKDLIRLFLVLLAFLGVAPPVIGTSVKIIS